MTTRYAVSTGAGWWLTADFDARTGTTSIYETRSAAWRYEFGSREGAALAAERHANQSRVAVVVEVRKQA